MNKLNIYDDVYKPEQQAFPATENDVIDFRLLVKSLWKDKWLIAVTTLLLSVAAVIFALYQPNIYRSDALLAPAEAEQGSGGLAALAGQFGGLASMAGINLGNTGSSDKSKLAIEVLTSRFFIQNFIEKHDILADVMAAKSWDYNSKELNYDLDDYDVTSNTWTRDVSEPFTAKPSLQEAYKEFVAKMIVSTSKDTGMTSLSIEHVSPIVAQKWVTWLIADINADMKNRDVSEAERSISFLKKQIEQTNVADIRSILYKLVEEQAKTIMFAEVRNEYVFKTIDPAQVTQEKAKPKRGLIVLLGVFSGIFLGLFISIIRYFFKK